VNRFVWPQILLGAALLIASSGLAPQLLGGVVSPDTLATWTVVDPTWRWICRVLGAIFLIQGLRLLFGTRSRPPPPLPPRPPARR
jgi:hypothetical protein